jgi:hypothetical protein
MNEVTPDKLSNLLEAAISASTSAWNAQNRYFDELISRNFESFSKLSEARISSLREIGASTNFNEAFEANIAYEDVVRDELKQLFEDNKAAWEVLQSELQVIYTPVTDDEDAA